MLNKKVEIENNGKKLYFDPVKDIDKIRRLEGFQIFVKAIGDMIHSGTSIETSVQKYAITDKDRKDIKLVGFSEHVMCWSTKGYETTNKFIFQLWQNEKTLGRGDVYGNPTQQTPYCTHSKQHWDDYSDGDPNYEQYWFLKKPDDDLTYVEGDLSNENVVHIFNSMKGLGRYLLIAMNDSNEDFLDKFDLEFDDFSNLEYGNEVKKINNKILDIIHKKYNNDVNKILSTVDIIDNKTIPKRLKKKITSIIIPNNVTSIGDNAFSNCSSLKEINIPDSITSIEDMAFDGCSSLKEITIPNSVTHIGESTFYDCISLKKVNIPNTVKSIGDWAFSYCESLTSVTIPESVTRIGGMTFYGCSSLKSIYVKGNIEKIKEVFEKTDNKRKNHLLKPLTINESIDNLILYWAELIKGNQY